MNNLRRELAPISDAAWQMIEEEAVRVLKLKLAGRKLVDFEGPKGPDHAAVNLGRFEPLKDRLVDGVEVARRHVLPLIELRTAFQLSRAELDAVELGAKDAELHPVIDAATRIAAAEDNAVFHGYPAAGIRGIDQASTHPTLPISTDYNAYPRSVAEATLLLRLAGVDGPYALALGPRCYTGLMQATGEGGYPVLQVVKKLIDGPIVWAPAVNGAILLSTRGGDFELTVGRDVSLGYLNHTDTAVELYLTESMTFRVLAPEAAVALAYTEEAPKQK
ncbi:MAG: family 1 encapsulin nanocompartment shell protein [Candidatus Binatia bacterium]